MKVLILTISTGNGHNKCAQALSDYLQSIGVSVDIIDVYHHIHPALSKLISELYDFSISKVPSLYAKVYTKGEEGQIIFMEAMNKFNQALAFKIKKHICDNGIDTVVTTHIFGGQILTYLKQKKHIDITSIGIVTDFTIHPHWEFTRLNYYITAHSLLNTDLAAKGVDIAKMHDFGIPIDLKFAGGIDKSAAKKKLGMDDKPLVLIMMGSMGYGDMARTLSEVDKSGFDCNIAVICGRNARVKALIEKASFEKKVYVYGFVDNVDLYMDAASLLVTKPGGLTVSEALAKRLPMMFIDPIPGQEDRNVEFLTACGAGIKLSRTFSIQKAINFISLHPSRLEEMHRCAQRICKPYAAKDLGDFIVGPAQDKKG